MQEQDWFIYSITLFTFIVLFTLCYIRHVYTYFNRNHIFNISPPTFPFGNVYDVACEGASLFLKLSKYFNKLRRKGRKCGGMYLFLKPSVVIADLNLIRRVFINNRDFQSCAQSKSLISDDLWDKIINDYCHTFCSSWKVIESFDATEVDFKRFFHYQIFVFCVNKLFDFKLSPEQNSQLSKSLAVSSDQSNNIVTQSYLKNLFSFSRKNVLKSVVKQAVQMKKQYILGHRVEDVDIVATFSEIFTTLKNIHDLILLSLYEIAQNKVVHKKVKDLQGVKDSSYLEAVIYETFRKYPPIPFVRKVCVNDFQLDADVKIEKNVSVFMSTYGVHHDFKNYFNPHQFQPERFVNNLSLRGDSAIFLPFLGSAEVLLEKRYVHVMREVIGEIVSNLYFTVGAKNSKLLNISDNWGHLTLNDTMWFQIKKK